MKRLGMHLLTVALLAFPACDASGNDRISKEEAIEIALDDWEELKGDPHSSHEEPSSISAEIAEVLADADDDKERVWVVRFDLPGGEEQGFYVDLASGRILGGFHGSP